MSIAESQRLGFWAVRANYATIMEFSSLVRMSGMMLGPLFAGYMADRLGDYKLAFSILATITGLGSLLFQMAKSPPPPPRVLRIMRYSSRGDEQDRS